MKYTFAILGLGLLVSLIIISSNPKNNSTQESTIIKNNVSLEGGKQIITLSAKGGYSPNISKAKSGIPTLLKVETKNTMDCSLSLVIPDLKYRNFLPSSGSTEINIPPQPAGKTLQGLCGMGMYGFKIVFE